MSPPAYRPASPAVTPDALAAYRTVSSQLVEHTITQTLHRMRTVPLNHGGVALRWLTYSIRHLSGLLDATLAYGELALLGDELRATNDKMASLGLPPHVLLDTLYTYHEAVRSFLPPAHAAEVNQFITWLIMEQQQVL